MSSIRRLSPLLAALVVAGCDSPSGPPEPPVLSLDAQLRASFGNWGVIPIGEMPVQNAAMVELGRALFFDKILSGNRDVSCATCHATGAGLGDGRSLSIGTGAVGAGGDRTLGPGRQFTSRSAPSLLNGGLGLPALFWDSRLARSGTSFVTDSGLVMPFGLPNILAAQALLPVLNRREMRGDPGDRDVAGQPNELALIADQESGKVWDGVASRLGAIQGYVALFGAAFPIAPKIQFADAARALAAFQMAAFVRTQSPFDRYLARDDGALSTAQKRGGILFFGEARCSQCHNGPFLGGQSFANVGAPQVGPGGAHGPLDRGVGERETNDFYQFAFRVAPLRNVELTAPYFHSGAYPTLEAVVRHYNNVALALPSYDPSQLAPDVRPFYHGEPATIAAVLQSLDGRLRQPLHLTDQQIADVVAFLESLTDPAARNLGALRPATVPSGLPVD